MDTRGATPLGHLSLQQRTRPEQRAKGCGDQPRSLRIQGVYAPDILSHDNGGDSGTDYSERRAPFALRLTGPFGTGAGIRLSPAPDSLWPRYGAYSPCSQPFATVRLNKLYYVGRAPVKRAASVLPGRASWLRRSPRDSPRRRGAGCPCPDQWSARAAVALLPRGCHRPR